jgi:hypothetical protein
MQFMARLREPVKRGEVTCSVRIWRSAHVKVGGRYTLPPGEIEVTSVREISLQDITPALARKSGFAGVVDLLKIAKHGPGERVYLIEFDYHGPGEYKAKPGKSPSAPSRSVRHPRSSPSKRATSARAARKRRGS